MTKSLLSAALMGYGIIHGYWRNAFNSELFRQGKIEKDEWVLNSAQIDLEQLLLIGIGMLFLAITIAMAMSRTRRMKIAEQVSGGNGGQRG